MHLHSRTVSSQYMEIGIEISCNALWRIPRSNKGKPATVGSCEPMSLLLWLLAAVCFRFSCTYALFTPIQML